VRRCVTWLSARKRAWKHEVLLPPFRNQARQLPWLAKLCPIEAVALLRLLVIAECLI